MSEALVKYIKEYIHSTITGFESGLYKMVKQTNPKRIKLMADRHQPFITILRDMHEEYYTRTFNSIITRNNEFVNETFGKFSKLCNHSKQCLLNILANLAVSVHFNLDRSKLDITDYESYCSTLSKEITKTMSVINIAKLFEHTCTGPADDKLVLLKEEEKFIKIEMSTMSNGVKKPLNSFTDTNNPED